MGQDGIRIEASRCTQVRPEAQPDQLSSCPAVGQRSDPAGAIAANQVQAGEPGIVQRRTRLSATEHGSREPAGTVGVIEREGSVPAGADDEHLLVGLQRLAGPLSGGGQIDCGSWIHGSSSLARQQGTGAVTGGRNDGLSPDCGLGHLQRTIAQVEARNPNAVLFPRKQNIRVTDGLRQPESFLGRAHRNDGLGAVAQGSADAGGGPEDVDDEYDPALYLGCAETSRGEENVDSHVSGRSSWDSRSRKRVSILLETKSGWRITRARKGIVVVTPSRMKLSSAWPMRLSASSRLLPWTITLARRES